MTRPYSAKVRSALIRRWRVWGGQRSGVTTGGSLTATQRFNVELGMSLWAAADTGYNSSLHANTWLAVSRRDIEVFYLPSYRPALHPHKWHNAGSTSRLAGKHPFAPRSDYVPLPANPCSSLMLRLIGSGATSRIKLSSAQSGLFIVRDQ